MKKPLTPRTIINSEGKMHYSESSQAWNVLKLKKELFEEFPDLKQKRSAFSYELTYFRDLKELEQTIKKLDKEGNKVPILMWLYKEG
jgi:hypothetical protein